MYMRPPYLLSSPLTASIDHCACIPVSPLPATEKNQQSLGLTRTCHTPAPLAAGVHPSSHVPLERQTDRTTDRYTGTHAGRQREGMGDRGKGRGRGKVEDGGGVWIRSENGLGVPLSNSFSTNTLLLALVSFLPACKHSGLPFQLVLFTKLLRFCPPACLCFVLHCIRLTS